MDSLVVSHLVLETAYTVPQFTTEWAARRLHLPGTGNLRGLAPHNLPGIAIANRLQLNGLRHRNETNRLPRPSPLEE